MRNIFMKISTKQYKTFSKKHFHGYYNLTDAMLLVQADDGPQPGPCVGPRHRHLLLPALQGAAAHTQGDQVGSVPRAEHYQR